MAPSPHFGHLLIDGQLCPGRLSVIEELPDGATDRSLHAAGWRLELQWHPSDGHDASNIRCFRRGDQYLLEVWLGDGAEYVFAVGAVAALQAIGQLAAALNLPLEYVTEDQ